MSKAKISTEEFDRKVEEGEDISEFVDFDLISKKVNVDFPVWMIEAMDAEADRLSIPRQAIIKMWIDEKLSQIKRERSLGDRRSEKGA